MSNKVIEPQRAYSLEETADLLSMHPAALRRKLSAKNRTKDEFIIKSNPQKIGKEWRFMGENLLKALGSHSYKSSYIVNKGDMPFE